MKKHELGFWELNPKPTKHELAQYYKKHYFDSYNFEVKYSDEEFFHKQIGYMEAEFVHAGYVGHSTQNKGLSFLDVGCGEAFSLNFFSQKGWKVTGIDYSLDGVTRHFPKLASFVQVGDSDELIEKMAVEGHQFDLINLNNVLEHLIDPVSAMKGLRKLVKPNGCLRVQVPNDFSELQLFLLESKMIDREFWVAPHEHVSYFGRDSLKKLFNHVGFGTVEALADYPIDVNLLNPETNYIMDASKGKACHMARVKLDNFLVRKSVQDFVTFRRGCGESGLGRNIIIYGRP